MKKGQTVENLMSEVQRRAKAKRDYIVRASKVELGVVENDLTQEVVAYSPTPQGRATFEIGSVAHEQLAQYTAIPVAYYRRMLLDEPDLLAVNVNRWMGRQDEARMLRVLDNRLRAVLSDKFNRSMENEDLAEPLFRVLNRVGADIVSCEITESKFYVKAVDKKAHEIVQRQTGSRMGSGKHAFFKDVLMPAIVVSNSEVGRGALQVRRSIFTEGCTNLAVLKEQSVKKTHVGAKHMIDGDATELSSRTRALQGASLISELTDVIEGTFDKAVFSKNVERIQSMTGQKVTGDIPEVIEVTRRTFGLSESEGRVLMRHFIEGADMTRYGLFNAMTRTAEDLSDYDRASDLERLGGEVIELTKSEWSRIAEAA